MGIEEELKEMEDLLTANTTAPNTETSGTEAPGTEAPGTEVPTTLAGVTELPSTEAPATEAPEPNDIDGIRDDIKRIYEALEKDKGSSTTAPSTDAPFIDESFLGDDVDMDDFIRSPEDFNKLLNKVYRKGIETARNEIRVSQESIPGTVKDVVGTLNSIRETSDGFYEDNKDLQPFKKVVGVVFSEKMSEDPNKSYEEILGQVAPEVRRRLGLKKPDNASNNNTKPKLPKRKAQGRPNQEQEPEPNSLQTELDEMNKSLNS